MEVGIKDAVGQDKSVKSELTEKEQAAVKGILENIGKNAVADQFFSGLSPTTLISVALMKLQDANIERPSRERHIAVTKLQEAKYWLSEGVHQAGY